MTTDLQGRVAVVTGGGQGFGRAIAEAFARAGASVVVAARTSKDLEETVTAIRQAGGNALAVTTDVTSPPAVRALCQEARATFGPADIVVHAAGVLGPFGPLWDVDPDAWWRAQEVHVRGAALCMSTFTPDMISNGGGRFIVLSSSASKAMRANHSAYHLAKHTQNHLISHLGAEGRPHGVFGWAIHPGWVATGMADAAIESSDALKYIPDVVEGFRQRTNEDDVHSGLRQCADFCLELASGRADQLSGTYLVAAEGIDGPLARLSQSPTEKTLRRAAGKARRIVTQRM